MPEPKHIDIKDLYLDLKNPRTIPQENEEKAIETMISIKPDRFYAVMESILDDGYLMTENIIVLDDGKSNIVKEGNRRVAILKLIHGIYDKKNYAIPSNLQNRIDGLTPEWLAGNRSIPCGVYSVKEADLVEKTVNLTHAKGEKASRDPWTSVAKARHSRDIKGGTELGLDLLEKYLKDGKNINQSQKERWSGDYPLTVLDEAIRKIYVRLNFTSVNDLVSAYPKMGQRLAIEQILLDIGLLQLGFNQIRDKNVDFLLQYGIAPNDEHKQGDGSASSGNKPDGKDGQTGGIPPQAGSDLGAPKGNSSTSQDENSQTSGKPAPSHPTPKSAQLGTPTYVKLTVIYTDNTRTLYNHLIYSRLCPIGSEGC